MKTIKNIFIFMLLLVGIQSCEDEENIVNENLPVVESISPASAYVNDIVTITGKNFAATAEGNIVRFGENIAKIKSVSENKIEVIAPNGKGEVNITVATEAGQSEESSLFTFLVPEIKINSITPAKGIEGDIVVISGDFFDENPFNNLVRFDDVVAEVAESSQSQLKLKVPPGKGLVNVSVTVGRNKSNAVEFRYEVAKTTLTSVEPDAGFAGDKVILKGTFKSPLESNKVKFGDALAVVENYSDTEMEVVIPQGSGSVGVTVSFGDETTPPVNFTYATIKLDNLSKVSGETGDIVVLSGNGFSNELSENEVFFGGNKAEVISLSDDKKELGVRVPVFADGNADVQVQAKVNGSISNALEFHLLQYYIETFAGTGEIGSSTVPVDAKTASMNQPINLVFDSSDNMYIAEAAGATVRKLLSSDNKIHFVAGKYNTPGNNDGTGENASFKYPYDLAVDKSGNIYVADLTNKLIRKITPGGEVSTLAGTPGSPSSKDGKGTEATFRNPHAVAFDLDGNLLIGDEFAVRKLNVNTLEVTTVSADNMNGATTAIHGHRRITGLAVDKTGNIYTCERMNNCVKKIDPDGTVSILAGPSDRTKIRHVDGPGSEALFFNPSGLAIADDGTLYRSDGASVSPYNYYIRKITPVGYVSTIAGIGSPPPPYVESGIGITVPLKGWGLAIDSKGHIYIPDQGNNLIRKLYLK